MIVRSACDESLELELYPQSDLREIVRVAELCEGIELSRVCKVSVIFIRSPLDKRESHANFPRREPRGFDDTVDLFECSDPDHI